MPAKLIYATSNTCADMLYATGFFACDPFIFFSADRQQGIIVSALEQGRAEKEVKRGIKVFEITDIMGPNEPLAQVKDIILKLNEKFPYNEWHVPADFPFSLAKYLLDKKMDIYCDEKRFFPEREVKKSKEIKSLENGLATAEKAMQCTADIIAEAKVDNQGLLLIDGEPVTSEFIKNEIGIAILKCGGTAEHTIVAGGKHGADPHNTGYGPLFAGQPIVVDIFPRVLEPENKNLLPGYWGDMTRTFVKGKAPAQVKKAYQAVKTARDKSQEKIRAGVSGADIHQFAQQILEDSGFKTGKNNNINYGFFHGLGHGVGLEIHEAPSLSLRNPQPLQAGNVVTVEPGLYYPEWGGIRLENMVEIQNDGCRLLTKFPDVLEID